MSTNARVALATYIHALLQATDAQSPLGRRLVDWLQHHSLLLGLDFEAVIRTRAASGRLRPKRNPALPLSRRSWEQLCAAVAAVIQPVANDDDIADANMAAFAARLRLTPAEVAILRFVFHASREKSFDRLCDLLIGTKAIDSVGLLALCLGLTIGDIWDGLTGGDLARLRLVQMTGDGTADFAYYLSWRVRTALLPPNHGLDAVEQALIGGRQTARLDYADYAHMASARDFVRELLRGALKGGKRGVNILLYGPPGTGKTEFCRVIAAAIDCDLYAVGEAGHDGDEIPRDERLDALRLADRLAARRGSSLLLFDEMEDVLQAGDRTVTAGRTVRRAGSKVFFNRLLENNEVPTLWTTNAIGEFDPAFLRRMTFVLEMKRMTMQRRVGLWHGAAARHSLALSDRQAQNLARRH
ncbi:MAG TPA: AAA family ATPase, partial [Terriglobales bacterium]|nr:AAA family ATPase [Terriglobales bacterium]